MEGNRLQKYINFENTPQCLSFHRWGTFQIKAQNYRRLTLILQTPHCPWQNIFFHSQYFFPPRGYLIIETPRVVNPN